MCGWREEANDIKIGLEDEESLDFVRMVDPALKYTEEELILKGVHARCHLTWVDKTDDRTDERIGVYLRLHAAPAANNANNANVAMGVAVA